MWVAQLLGALVVWVPLLAVSLGVSALIAMAVWFKWQRLQRARAAAWWAAQQPYDRARIRTAETVAWENGERDELADIEAMRSLER